ncbi:hypothetical protein P4O66_021659 [Electrophorus voltai]|uniref:Uncharacterized protein n=1 Tax=Electrophorus voltai TaxID=2609070 RepID=A0AAD8ZPL8_9TELE|nr:hypothetical protein P4O66_021659 [Electrophorus voltai]
MESSDKMKDAECTIENTKKTEENIKRLQRKLTEECEVQGLKASTSEEVQCEITVKILRAMAKHSGRDLLLSCLKNLFRSDFVSVTPTGFSSSDTLLLKNVSVLLLILGHTHTFLKSTAGKVAKRFGAMFGTVAAKGISAGVTQLARISLKTVLKGSGRVARGILGLVLTVPDLVENCEELIKNKHDTEASNYLKKKKTN